MKPKLLLCHETRLHSVKQVAEEAEAAGNPIRPVLAVKLANNLGAVLGKAGQFRQVRLKGNALACQLCFCTAAPCKAWTLAREGKSPLGTEDRCCSVRSPSTTAPGRGAVSCSDPNMLAPLSEPHVIL